MSREKIIFLSVKNPESKKDWSGIPYYMFHALREIYDVEWISGPKLGMTKRMLHYLGKALQRLTGSKFIFDYGGVTARLYGRYYSRVLAGKSDIKFVFVPAGLTEISDLQTNLPVVAVGDCSVLQLLDYYPALNGVSAYSRTDVEQVERSALERCARIVFSSNWASDFVRSRYGVECRVIPFGANIRPAEVLAKKMSDSCRLLVVGVDWQRKGGDSAMEIQRLLINSEVGSSLTVVGMRPESDDNLPPYVNFVSVDKDSESGELTYIELLKNSDFLLLPTLADCTPIVIAEAFAAGLPVLATRTGGIPSMIDEGVTGFLFEAGDAKGYSERIMKLLDQPELYTAISANCLAASRNIFNWKHFALEIKKLCATL